MYAVIEGTLNMMCGAHFMSCESVDNATKHRGCASQLIAGAAPTKTNVHVYAYTNINKTLVSGCKKKILVRFLKDQFSGY